MEGTRHQTWNMLMQLGTQTSKGHFQSKEDFQDKEHCQEVGSDQEQEIRAQGKNDSA